MSPIWDTCTENASKLTILTGLSAGRKAAFSAETEGDGEEVSRGGYLWLVAYTPGPPLATNAKGRPPGHFLFSWDTVLSPYPVLISANSKKSPGSLLTAALPRWQGKVPSKPSPFSAHERHPAHKATGVQRVYSLQAPHTFHKMSAHGKVTSPRIACPGGCTILPSFL